MPFHQHWEARTEFELRDVLKEPKFFSEFKNSLHVGARITLLQYTKVGTHGVDSEGIRGIVVIRIGNIDLGTSEIEYIVEGDIQDVAPPVIEPEVVNDGPVVKKVFPEDGYSYIVEDAYGNTVERFKLKREAEAYINA
jgi:hypothetical protein